MALSPTGFKSAAHYLVLNNLAPLAEDAAAEGSAEHSSAAAGETVAAGGAVASETATAAAGGGAEEEVPASPEAAGEHATSCLSSGHTCKLSSRCQ